MSLKLFITAKIPVSLPHGVPIENFSIPTISIHAAEISTFEVTYQRLPSITAHIFKMVDREILGSKFQMLRAMLHQEAQHYSVENVFLRPDLHRQRQIKSCPSVASEDDVVMSMDEALASDDLPIDPECRFRMAEWCYQLSDHCGFKRETVAITMSCLDRFLACRPTHDGVFADRTLFQLAAISTFYTSVKTHELYAMNSELMSRLSRGIFTPSQIESFEMEILLAIGFRVNPPTALAFCKHLLDAMPVDWLPLEIRETVLELAKYQTEVAVCDAELIHIKPSWIGMASLMNAMESIKDQHQIQRIVGDGMSNILGIKMDDADFQTVRVRLYEGLSGETTVAENRFSTQIQPQPPSCMKDYAQARPQTTYLEISNSVMGHCC